MTPRTLGGTDTVACRRSTHAQTGALSSRSTNQDCGEPFNLPSSPPTDSFRMRPSRPVLINSCAARFVEYPWAAINGATQPTPNLYFSRMCYSKYPAAIRHAVLNVVKASHSAAHATRKYHRRHFNDSRTTNRLQDPSTPRSFRSCIAKDFCASACRT
jgi:hypothetical protein